ncbi:MAG: carbohydrate binding domain-containing protein, partial [Acetatifactor sp.]|nr:carbohydrate binding domain-containing protein [Acetatifactor sp.]
MFQKMLNLKKAGCLLTAACLLTACGGPADNAADGTLKDSQPVSASETPASSSTDSESRIPTADYVIHTDASALDASHAISDTLYGIFLEDINHALDGGMYAELVKNRSFEYGGIAGNQNKHGWTSVDSVKEFLDFSIIDGTEDGSCLHENNPHYARLTCTNADMQPGIFNRGYLSGMNLEEGKEYVFSAYLKSPDGYDGSVAVSLLDRGSALACQEIPNITDQWQKYELTFTIDASPAPLEDAVGTNLEKTGTVLLLQIGKGTVDMDMVSLMPVDTYKDLPIRKDLGEMLEALNPSFLRFPGGCVIEGRDEESMYSWKDSIGSGAQLTVGDVTTTGGIEVRPQSYSIWKGTQNHPYYTTYGIGFYEFFELCEALDCMPVPVLNAGMTCQVQSPKYIVYDVNSEEFRQSIQDALDLVEFCKGDASTH